MSEPVNYMERTRQFYKAQGFDRPYQWAHFDDIPFHLPDKPASNATVTIITTAVHPNDKSTPMIGRKARSIPFEDVPENFYTDDLSWDKNATHTDDRRSYFPLETLELLAEGGAIGALAPHYHFVPTEYSQRNTIESDAPAIVSACVKDEVDIAILVPL
ncbi:MAG: hypothetical protein WD002_09530 [Pseudomonadales bacterium]